MKVGQVKTGQIISIKNLLGINEVFLILQKQDVLGKVCAYKGSQKSSKGRIVYLSPMQNCKIITNNAIRKN